MLFFKLCKLNTQPQFLCFIYLNAIFLSHQTGFLSGQTVSLAWHMTCLLTNYLQACYNVQERRLNYTFTSSQKSTILVWDSEEGLEIINEQCPIKNWFCLVRSLDDKHLVWSITLQRKIWLTASSKLSCTLFMIAKKRKKNRKRMEDGSSRAVHLLLCMPMQSNFYCWLPLHNGHCNIFIPVKWHQKPIRSIFRCLSVVYIHREHTILLSGERVSKGTKRMYFGFLCFAKTFFGVYILTLTRETTLCQNIFKALQNFAQISKFR